MTTVMFSKEAEKIYQLLKKSNKKEDLILIKAIDNKVELLKIDPQIGDKIKKKQIPKELKVESLFRIELPCFWRILYTIENEQPEVIALVININNHKNYNKIMKY